ncbi:hypothetical protein EDB83DRAFT_2550646 [Lactarius deliciosus]|nr:hypothetical protein EDB83DRAFT_2550646 [Lactarius deliciosus]
MADITVILPTYNPWVREASQFMPRDEYCGATLQVRQAKSSGRPKDAAGVGFITHHHPAVLPTSCDAVTCFIKLFGVLSVVLYPKARNPVANGLRRVHVPFPELPGEKMITDTYGIAESHEEGDEMPANLMGTTRDQRMKFHVQFKLIALELLVTDRRETRWQRTASFSRKVKVETVTQRSPITSGDYSQLDRHSLIRKSGGDKQIPEETEAEAMEDCDGLSY